MKQKSFVQNLTWIWVLLLGMGAIFLGIAIVMQLIPITPESMNYTVNGVRQPATEQTVRTFRLVFLLAFGISGLATAVPGIVILARTGGKRRLAKRLREDGVCVMAQVVESAPSHVRINNHYLTRLRCAFTDSTGTHYVFKSDLLRMDPTPYLENGQVAVYYDRDNMSRYFVDVDGSAGLGTRIVEL